MKKTNVLKSISFSWYRFWSKKGSVLIKDYINNITFNTDWCKIYNSIYELEDNKNLFMTINWYKKWFLTREEKYLNRYNAFFLDIDIKDNQYSKEDKDENIKNEIRYKIMEYQEDFDFIIETYSWFHLYILIDTSKYLNNNWSLKKELYKNDWKETKNYYEKILELNIDKWGMKITQIWRVPWTYHQKKIDQPPFEIKLLKWNELLEESVIDKINREVSIIKVLDIFNIKYDNSDLTIIENNIKTNWYKIDLDWNYVNNFTKSKQRAIWGVFSFVKSKMQESFWEWNYKKVMIETYNFFEKHFWIIPNSKSSKQIILNKFISINLFKSSLSQNNLKYFLMLQHFANQNKIIDWNDSWEIELWELKLFMWNERVKLSTILKNLEDLNNKSLIKVSSKEKNIIDEFKIINIDFLKWNWYKIKFCIFPEINDLKNKIFNTKYFHYMNKNILEVKTNNNKLLSLYLYIFEKLIIGKKEKIFISNECISLFEINKNQSLRNKKLNNFWKTIWDFNFIKIKDKGFDIINEKIN